MSNIYKYKEKKEHNSPSNLLKNGLDSIVFLFEKKNNDYYKKISEFQIIINNLQIKNKKLIKENYILKKNNTHQNKIIEELRNENNNLKNIINNIKGKLNIDLRYKSVNNINDINNSSIDNHSFNNNKIRINKLSINNYGENIRTRNISNITGQVTSSLNKDVFLTDRFHKKNNVLGNNLNRKKELKTNKRLFINKKLEKNLSFNEYIFKIKDNYYSRQRSKNNSFNQYFFNQEIKNVNSSLSETKNRKNLLINKKEIKKKIRFIESDDANLRTINNLSNPQLLLDKYINDSKNLKIYNTIELY